MMGMFGAESTTDDVLEGVDLSGRRILVTGVSSGMGVEIARVLAMHGASVIGTVRDVERARAAHALVDAYPAAGRLELVELDLASLANVRACADALVASGNSLDLVVANAGVMAGPQGSTADGFETQFGTNHLGHFALINRTAGLLVPGGRVVMISSAGHRRADVDLDDSNNELKPYDEYQAYGRSKTATILFAVAFDGRHRSHGVRATAAHPGAVMTGTVRKMVENLGDGRDAALAAYDWKTVAQGAATAVWAGIGADAADVGARYCEDCHVADIDDDPRSRAGVRSYALDPDRAEALWDKSEELIGERFR